jgi:phosphoadenosine phosphosulfate reductase
MQSINSVVETLETVSAQEGLAWVARQFKRPLFSSALGEEDQAITYLITSQSLPIGIFTLDTGRLFAETYDLLSLTQKKYATPIQVFFPQAKEVEAYVQENGINGFYDSVENRKRCCHMRKVEPLKRALAGSDLWITGLRAGQSTNRQQMKKIEWDSSMNLFKYNPLLNWSTEQLREFIQTHAIPVNTLHKKGFESIGCAPCTRAIAPGEDIRAGRWWWESSAKECGLHQTKITVTTQH